MRSLKALVIGMAVLIAIGMTVVLVEIANRMSSKAPSAAAVGTQRLAVPAGARVVETVLDGGRIALRLALPDGTVRIAIYELATGRRLADLAVEPAPAESREGGG